MHCKLLWIKASAKCINVVVSYFEAASDLWWSTELRQVKTSRGTIAHSVITLLNLACKTLRGTSTVALPDTFAPLTGSARRLVKYCQINRWKKTWEVQNFSFFEDVMVAFAVLLHCVSISIAKTNWDVRLHRKYLTQVVKCLPQWLSWRNSTAAAFPTPTWRKSTTRHYICHEKRTRTKTALWKTWIPARVWYQPLF